MFQKLASHNEDIRRLVEDGYAVDYDSGYLIVRDIPYLDENGGEQWGAIVTKLVFTNPEHVSQDDHQVFFAGSPPHNVDRTPIANLGGGAVSLTLSAAASEVVVQRSFSNKPQVNGQALGFADFHAKIRSYVNIISGPAMALHNSNPYTFRIAQSAAEDSIFKIQDTMTSRAEITGLSAKFREEIVAIIGLGGTGAYVLDLIVKTAVKEVRGFDRDPFHVHNAFRSPGRFSAGEFQQSKAQVYQDRYDNFRHGLKLQAKFIDASCAHDLKGVTFAFVCVDKGSARAGIFELLIAKGIPFIDVGMGLNRKHELLSGMMRATYYAPDHASAMKDKYSELKDHPNEEYRLNIQIAELNALNAALAVIHYKRLKGFYVRSEDFYFSYSLNDGKIATRSAHEQD
jgi:hypothetical protein